MKQNRYRLFSIFAAFIAIYLIIFFVNKSDINKLTNGILKNVLIETGLPSYAYMSNLDKNAEFSIAGSIINDIYPMNEYLLAGESAGMSLIDYNRDNKNNMVVSANISNEIDPNGLSNQNNQETQGATEPQTTQADNKPVMDVISKNVISGMVYDRANLNNYNYVCKNFYTVTSITSLTSSILRPKEFLDQDLSMAKDPSKPQILIFHTHSQETFMDSVENDPSTSIVGVGDYLTKVLTDKYGYNVIHDTSEYDMVDGKLDRSKAYTYAENGIAKIMEENPSIEVVIDLHRDGVPPEVHLVTEIDGKQVARLMFFNGISYSNAAGDIGYLYNPNRDGNLAMSLQMQLLGEAYYPGLLKNIYINAYRYCLHERAKSMLIEAGANTNTVEEMMNAMEPLADMLDKLLRGEKAY
jgi:stage II sporulation protein P